MKSAIVEAFAQMAKEKNIDRDVLESIIKDSFRKMMEKKYGLEANYEVIVNMEKGIIEIYLYRTIVKEIEDPVTEIDIASAQEKSDEEFAVGDDYIEEIPIEDFGRRLVLNLKQNLNQKIREIEKEVTFNTYKDIVGDIIVGEVYQIKPNSILLIHSGNEIIFPRSEQIQKERYRKGDTVRAIIKSIEKRSSGPPLIIVSRADEQFLYKLFELEIPEVYDGIIEIKAIAREPGERAKIAVYSNDDKIDAVGACVGMKGIRIHSIVRELSNENIDVINYTEESGLYIARALSPAKLQDIYLDTDNKVAKIYADEDQVSLIIGKGGQNIKLASRLTGYEINVVREEEEEEVEDEGKDVEMELVEAEQEQKVQEETISDEEQKEGALELVKTNKVKKTKAKPRKSKKKTEEPAGDESKEEKEEAVKKKETKAKAKPRKSKKKTEEPAGNESKEEKEEVVKKKETKTKAKPRKSKKKTEEPAGNESKEEKEEVVKKKETKAKSKSRKSNKKSKELEVEQSEKELMGEEKVK